jgi:uncharacterized protein (DUF433 family)
MTQWSDCSAVERDVDRLGGAWVFEGTRVPVTTFFENLEVGATVDEFVEWFPGVTRAQVLAVLRHTELSLMPVAA